MSPSTSSHPTDDNVDGSRPVLAHPFKTQLCKNFCRTGVCPYRHRCMFAHGKQELRTLTDNLRDGLLSEASIRLFREAKEKKRAANRRRRERLAPEPVDRTSSKESYELESHSVGHSEGAGEPGSESAWHSSNEASELSPTPTAVYRHHPYVSLLLDLPSPRTIVRTAW